MGEAAAPAARKPAHGTGPSRPSPHPVCHILRRDGDKQQLPDPPCSRLASPALCGVQHPDLGSSPITTPPGLPRRCPCCISCSCPAPRPRTHQCPHDILSYEAGPAGQKPVPGESSRGWEKAEGPGLWGWGRVIFQGPLDCSPCRWGELAVLPCPGAPSSPGSETVCKERGSTPPASSSWLLFRSQSQALLTGSLPSGPSTTPFMRRGLSQEGTDAGE